MDKISWSGRIGGVQPRIRLLRSYDQRQHTYLGYVLLIDGEVGDEAGKFIVAVGKGTHEKYQFQANMEIRGFSVPVSDPQLEIADFFKTSRIKINMNPEDKSSGGPPFLGIPPDLQTYRERGHRRLDADSFLENCTTCMWGCCMPVEMTIDHWNPSDKDYRIQTFCYGPKSCKLYIAGPTRKVPGRRGMVWEEEDWIDEDATSNRGPDD